MGTFVRAWTLWLPPWTSPAVAVCATVFLHCGSGSCPLSTCVLACHVVPATVALHSVPSQQHGRLPAHTRARVCLISQCAGLWSSPKIRMPCMSDLRSSLKKQFGIWRALHESVVFVHDPEKQYRWPRPEMAARRHTGVMAVLSCVCKITPMLSA